MKRGTKLTIHTNRDIEGEYVSTDETGLITVDCGEEGILAVSEGQIVGFKASVEVPDAPEPEANKADIQPKAQEKPEVIHKPKAAPKKAAKGKVK